MLGLNISASFNSAVTIYILIPFLIIPQLLLSGVIVKFDKLNPAITSQSYVPFSGEVMTSRWAFEALAIRQFKDNKFDRNLYKYDKAISIATYKKDYWLAEMNKKLEFCEANYNKPAKKQEVVAALQMIRNEIEKELKVKTNSRIKCMGLSKLNIGAFEPAVSQQIHECLDDLKLNYQKNFKNATELKDKEVSQLTKDTISRNNYLKQKDEYQNESLSDLVKNRTTPYRILDLNGEYIQKIEPVYLDPASNYGRAHFFAPRKKFFGTFYDTFWFNLCVIWGMSVILAITLYFDVLKKFINMLENVFSSIGRKRK
jgi:hypothetical protein